MAKTVKQIQTALNRAGIENEAVMIYNVDGSGGNAIGVMAYHDYTGLYPSAETHRIMDIVNKIAKNNRTECRGYYTATLIYC